MTDEIHNLVAATIDLAKFAIEKRSTPRCAEKGQRSQTGARGHAGKINALRDKE